MANKIKYQCDGEVPTCKKKNCFKNGGSCQKTSDIEHAVHFLKGAGDGYYTEIPRDPDEKSYEVHMSYRYMERAKKAARTAKVLAILTAVIGITIVALKILQWI